MKRGWPHGAVEGQTKSHRQFDGVAIEHRQAPGNPSVTGSMFVFGSSPKRLGLAENNLVLVSNSTWTSNPMTISQPLGSALECVGADEALLMTLVPVRRPHETSVVHQGRAPALAHRRVDHVRQYRTARSWPHDLPSLMEL